MNNEVFEKSVSQDQVSPTKLSPDKVGVGPSYPSRRKFLASVSGVTAAMITPSVLGVASLLGPDRVQAQGSAAPPPECSAGCRIGPETPRQRADHARRIRIQAATLSRGLALPDHTCNEDKETYRDRNFFASFSKGLPHDELGEVDPNAYCALHNALATGRPDDFEALPMGCPDGQRQRRFVNPQSGLCFDLEGPDSHHLTIPPAPAFSSAEQAGEIAELYWMALARDVPFTDYDRNPITQSAADDLSGFSDFLGPNLHHIINGV